jgi:hypothetical protein
MSEELSRSPIFSLEHCEVWVPNPEGGEQQRKWRVAELTGELLKKRVLGLVLGVELSLSFSPTLGDLLRFISPEHRELCPLLGWAVSRPPPLI